MAKKLDADPDRVPELDGKTPFVQLSLDLLTSTAWTGQSINCRRLIDFLLAEHLRHARLENGRLFATWDQLVSAGIGRRFIATTILESERRGLAEAERGARAAGNRYQPTRFRLTFVRALAIDDTGKRYYTAPTNEWRDFPQTENRIHLSKGAPDQCTFMQSPSAPLCSPALQTKVQAEGKPAETLDSASPTGLSKGEPLYNILGGMGEAPASTAAPHGEQPLPEAVPDRPSCLVSDPRQIDLEDFLDSKNSAAKSPIEKLRADLKAKFAASPKGEQSRVAQLVNLSRPQISNFVAGRFNVNSGAAALLRRYINGEIAA